MREAALFSIVLTEKGTSRICAKVRASKVFPKHERELVMQKQCIVSDGT